MSRIGSQNSRRGARTPTEGSSSDLLSNSGKSNLEKNYDKLKMYFALDAFVVFSCVVSISLFAFSVIDEPTAMYFIPPFFTLLISTLFFVTFIAWFTSIFSFSRENYEINVIMYALRSRFLSNALVFSACLICAPFYWRDFVHSKENFERVQAKSDLDLLKHRLGTEKNDNYSLMVLAGSGVFSSLMLFPLGILMIESFNKVSWDLRQFNHSQGDGEEEVRGTGYLLAEGDF